MNTHAANHFTVRCVVQSLKSSRTPICPPLSDNQLKHFTHEASIFSYLLQCSQIWKPGLQRDYYILMDTTTTTTLPRFCLSFIATYNATASVRQSVFHKNSACMDQAERRRTPGSNLTNVGLASWEQWVCCWKRIQFISLPRCCCKRIPNWPLNFIHRVTGFGIQHVHYKLTMIRSWSQTISSWGTTTMSI